MPPLLFDAEWSEKALARHEITLTWDPAVLDTLSADYDIHYGARSLQHSVDQRVVNRLAHAHEHGKLEKGLNASF